MLIITKNNNNDNINNNQNYKVNEEHQFDYYSNHYSLLFSVIIC